MLTTHDNAKQNLYWKCSLFQPVIKVLAVSHQSKRIHNNVLNVVVEPECVKPNQHKDTHLIALADAICYLIVMYISHPSPISLSCVPSCFQVAICPALNCPYQLPLNPASAGSRPSLWSKGPKTNLL